jgi:hypothetical protein
MTFETDVVRTRAQSLGKADFELSGMPQFSI